MDIHRLDARRITTEAFAPFGQVLGQDDDADEHRVVARYRNGQEPMPSVIAEVNPDGVPRCGWLARHHDQTQALTPIDGPIVLVLVPAGLDPLAPEGADAARAFVADVGEGIQLDEDVWHWAASVARGSVRVANLQGHRWPEDNEIVSLEDRGVCFAPRHEWIDRAWAAELVAVGTAALAAYHGARPAEGSVATSGARLLPDGRTWLVSDVDGAVELDDERVVEVVRARG